MKATSAIKRSKKYKAPLENHLASLLGSSLHGKIAWGNAGTLSLRQAVGDGGWRYVFVRLILAPSSLQWTLFLSLEAPGRLNSTRH